jgi:DNA polymerase III alpha subunit (gram-positive type)
VKHQSGIRNLYKIVSVSSTEYFHNDPVVFEKLYRDNNEGLVLASHPNEGEV